MDKLLADLNEAQREAVTATEGYVRVVAGAGTGKTKTLSRRFVYLAEALGISPAAILCVTFTNQAAAEMKRRIRALLPGRDLGYICTFHSFAVTLLREDCHVVQYPETFAVLDNLDKEDMLKGIFADLGITSRKLTVKDASDYIACYKGGHDYVPHLIDPDLGKLSRAEAAAGDLRQKVLWRYLYETRKTFGLDFDDLIYFALHILRTDEASREKWQSRLEYIMVDEYQDIDKDEYAFSEILAGKHRNLFVVGDPDQTIYTFRGADVRFILDFAAVHPEGRTICLKENYRSRPPVLTAANALIAHNRNRLEKDLLPTRSGGAKPLFHHAKTPEAEAAWVTEQLRARLEAGDDPGGMAILYRAHHQSRSFEEALIRAKIPYTLYNGVEFYHRKEIKDVLCYLRMVFAGDDLSFLRTVNEPRRSMGKKRIAFLREQAVRTGDSLYDTLKKRLESPVFHGTKAADYVRLIESLRQSWQGMKLTDLLSRLLTESGYEEYLRLCGAQDRLDNLSELKQSIFDYETSAGEEVTLGEYLDLAALFTDLDRQEKVRGVRLMTVHAAKGLEFPTVFLAGFSEGSFPSRRVLTPEGLEEERRLCYVAFTRAEDRLFLSDSEGPPGSGSLRLPSRFLFDAGVDNLEFTEPLDPSLLLPDALPLPPMAGDFTFGPGDRVKHPILGAGTVEALDAEKNAYLIRFDQLATSRSISAGMKLERI